MNIRLTLSVASLVLMASGTAHAIPITGDISFFGQFNPIAADGSTTGIGVATGLDFVNDAFTVDQVSGDFAASGLAKGDAGVINDFQFNPLTPAPLTPLWAVGTFQFDLYSLTIQSQTSSQLRLSGTGIVRGLGFEDTAGSWSFWGDAKGGLFGFGSSATTTTASVPEPRALLLFGSGLLGLAFLVRRRSAPISAATAR